MNKEEILRKSREDFSKKDGILKEHFKNTRPILIAVLVTAFFLFWLDIKYLGSDLIVDSVSLLVYAMIAADAFYCFRLSGKKIWIVLAILETVSVLLNGYLLFETVANYV